MLSVASSGRAAVVLAPPHPTNTTDKTIPAATWIEPGQDRVLLRPFTLSGLAFWLPLR
jgi:hypothetical protein